jgi:hypothetical protein
MCTLRTDSYQLPGNVILTIKPSATGYVRNCELFQKS